MNLSFDGATFVRADRATVWRALDDVDIISGCLPGCRSLVRTSDRSFALVLRVHLGPFRAQFDGTVAVIEADPLRLYRLAGSGTAGKAGQARGTASIIIDEHAEGCSLRYRIDADAQGMVAAAGSRVLAGVGQALANLFAARFGDRVRRRAGLRRLPALQSS